MRDITKHKSVTCHVRKADWLTNAGIGAHLCRVRVGHGKYSDHGDVVQIEPRVRALAKLLEIIVN